MNDDTAHSAPKRAIDALGHALDQLASTIGGLEERMRSVHHDDRRHQRLRAEVQAALIELDDVITAAQKQGRDDG